MVKYHYQDSCLKAAVNEAHTHGLISSQQRRSLLGMIENDMFSVKEFLTKLGIKLRTEYSELIKEWIYSYELPTQETPKYIGGISNNSAIAKIFSYKGETFITISSDCDRVETATIVAEKDISPEIVQLEDYKAAFDKLLNKYRK